MIEITEDALKAADLWSGQIPLHDLEEALGYAAPHMIRPVLNDLRDRMANADHSLRNHIYTGDRTDTDIARINGKAEGVRLALSYLDEILSRLEEN